MNKLQNQTRSGGSMKFHPLSAILILLFITACNGTFQVGVEYTPSGTATVRASSTVETNPTATPVQPPPTQTPFLPTKTALPPTETQAPPDITPGPQFVQMFLIAVGDNGQSGTMIGCGDSLIPVQIEIAPSQGVLRASLEALLSLKDQYYGESGLYNALYQSDLQLESVTVEAGVAVIKLTGSLMLGGECDNPRVAAQLDATARQFPTVSDASIFINGKALADVLSLKGLPGN
jgi:Sporulation and spore germination